MENKREYLLAMDATESGLLINRIPIGYLRHDPTKSSFAVYKKIGWFKKLMIDWCFGLKYYEYGKEK
jgi:hypothetical protein